MIDISGENRGKILSRANFIRENLPLIILIPTILGGFQQTLQLILISPSLFRFFSLSQLVIDGLFIMIYFIIIVLIPLSIAKRTMSFSKNLDFIGFTITSFVLIILFVLNSICMVVYREQIKSNIFLDFFSQILLFFLAGCSFFNQYPKSTYEKLKSKTLKVEKFMIATCIIIGFAITSLMFTKITDTIPIDNFKVLEKKYKDKGKIEILYFNDKYIFIRINSSKIHIEKLDSIL